MLYGKDKKTSKKLLQYITVEELIEKSKISNIGEIGGGLEHIKNLFWL